MQVRIKYRTTPVATKEYIHSNSVKYKHYKAVKSLMEGLWE